MDPVIKAVRLQLINSSDERTRQSAQHFFKEKVKHYGVKSAVVYKIATECFKSLKERRKGEVFALCEYLWRFGYMEESFVACEWAYRLRKDYEPADYEIFRKWVNTYIGNWASCDTLCNHTVGAFVEMYPQFLSGMKKWALSKNRWVRRASAVSLIIPARHGKFLKDIFEIADILLLDQDDMVQKGYGWMLKAASQAHQNEVFKYVMRNKAVMPRTALRYAIEKMPKELKVRAMLK